MMTKLYRIVGVVLKDRAAPFLFATLGVALCLLLLKNESADHRNYLVPWMKIVQARGWASVSGEFSNYTPPYVYLMNVVAPLVPKIGVAISLKLINIIFLILASAFVYLIVRATPAKGYAAAAAGMTLAIPTVIANSFAWGQCDIIYGCLILGAAWAAITDRPVLCGGFLGAALAFKLQTVFVFPAFLYLFLVGRLRFDVIFFAVVTYILFMTPAMMAGRTFVEVLSTYVGQADTYHKLSMNAPSLWYLVQMLDILSYEQGTRIGLLLAGVIAVGASLLLTFKRIGKVDFILVLSFFATLMPYVLPKMHDRYFFIADLTLFTLAFARPRLWWLAALAQIGSLSAYCEYFGASRFLPIPKDITVLGVIAFGVILIALFLELWRLPASTKEARPSSWLLKGPLPALYRSHLDWSDDSADGGALGAGRCSPQAARIRG